MIKDGGGTQLHKSRNPYSIPKSIKQRFKTTKKHNNSIHKNPKINSIVHKFSSIQDANIFIAETNLANMSLNPHTNTRYNYTVIINNGKVEVVAHPILPQRPRRPKLGKTVKENTKTKRLEHNLSTITRRIEGLNLSKMNQTK